MFECKKQTHNGHYNYNNCFDIHVGVIATLFTNCKLPGLLLWEQHSVSCTHQALRVTELKHKSTCHISIFIVGCFSKASVVGLSFPK